MKRLAGLLIALVIAAGLVASAPTADASPICKWGISCGKVCLTQKSRMNVKVADYWDKWAKKGGGHGATLKPGQCSDRWFHDTDAVKIPANWHAVGNTKARGKATTRLCLGPGWHKIHDFVHVTLTTVKGRHC